MTFDEAESKFKELQARVQRGEAISRAEYEAQVSQLGVYDDKGVLWEINPRTGKWMYFDGAEWVPGRPPGRDQSTVMPLAQLANPPSTVAPRQSIATPATSPTSEPPPARSTQPFRASAPTSSPSTTRPATTPPPRSNAPSAPRAATGPESVEAYKIAGTEKSSGATPPRARGMTGGAGKSEPPGGSRGNIFAGKPWLPFVIGAAVLLVCAILLFVGANIVLPAFQPTRTATRVALPPTVPPTRVQLPSPTPIPPTPLPVLAKITTTTANVREAPGTTGKIITTLKKNNQITLIAQTNGQTIAGKNVWYQINIADQNKTGWIFGDNVEIVSGDPKTLPTVAGTPTPTPKGGAPKSGATATLTPIGGPTPTTKP